MAKRKWKASDHPRYQTGPNKGKFKPKGSGGTKKKAARKNAPKAKGKPRRAPARQNPRRPDLVEMLMDGTMAAGQVLVGKAAARSVPTMLGLPKQGVTGLAIQAAVALLSGYVASMFLAPGSAAAIMAGGLTAPIETALVAYNVPWIGPALAPTTIEEGVANLGVGRYPRARTGLSRYPQGLELLAGYPDGGEVLYDDPDAS